jgi:hypothetical protein
VPGKLPHPVGEALAVRDGLDAKRAQEVEGPLGRRPDDPGARAPRELHGEHADTAGRAADSAATRDSMDLVYVATAVRITS